MQKKLVDSLLIITLASFLGGCLMQEDQSTVATAGQSQISFPALGVQVTGMSAVLDISGMGSYAMTVNGDNTVSASVTGITPGWHTLTITYYGNTIVLAQVSSIVEIKNGQNTLVSYTAEQLNRNFDDDSDGWVNLAEMLLGTDPLFASSMPPSEQPAFGFNISGGESISVAYTLHDSFGEAIESGAATSNNYTMEGGFTAYP